MIFVKQAKHSAGRSEPRNRFTRRNWIVTKTDSVYVHRYVYTNWHHATEAAGYLAANEMSPFIYADGLVGYERYYNLAGPGWN